MRKVRCTIIDKRYRSNLATRMAVVALAMSARSLDIHDWIYPLLVGAASATVCAKWGYLLADQSTYQSWHLDQVYTAVFGFLAVTTGFLATFYATLQSTTEGFVQRIRNTKGHTLEKFLTLTKYTIVIGFVAAMASIPMIVVAPMPSTDFDIATIMSSLWLGLAIWAIASFIAIATSFFVLLETPAPPRRGAG
jgi:hypothetical protein